VAVHERAERPKVLGTQRVGLAVLPEHALDHQGIDVDQADPEQAQREHREFLILAAVASELVVPPSWMNPLALFQFSAGKTRLALEVANLVADEFVNGVALVELPDRPRGLIPHALLLAHEALETPP
jgi:hypothetical protein